MSGGPDSIALLLLAHAAQPGLIEAATVDHGLRPESAGEAAFVAELCAELGVPHATLKVEVGKGNLQQEARLARYEALGRWRDERNLDAVMTAHHADDQAETLLMRLNRGSGLSGLAGVRTFNEIPGWGGTLFRPLLDWRKSELEAIVSNAGIEPVRDPTNEDDRFDRARIRKVLADADWLDVAAIARSAALLGEADNALRIYAQDEWKARVREVSGQISYKPRLDAPRELHLRVLDRAIRALGGDPRLSQVSDLLDALRLGGGGNLAGVLAQVKDGQWVFKAEPPRS